MASAGVTFTAKGYSGTTLDDLVAATGLGKQSTYNSFGGKHALFLRALSLHAGEAIAELERALTTDAASPFERVKGQLLKLAIALSDGDAASDLFIKATIEMADSDSAVAESAHNTISRMSGVYRDCIEDAQACGEVSVEADATALANYFVAVTRGTEVVGSAGADRATLTAIALTSLGAIPGSATRPRRHPLGD
ncbi:TetR/AcrR family transcriptional regulator [Lacisediminihabitans changchengi]|uniref:TetR/AcrR family transcriptional regulator n=1 Tax=Lacisediminihabitans changchengi TaxID=2787634 RepID=UPI0027DD05CB|nr:TetR/AcrR family transcriptional regulator [Lacisediminihabitans changchengi]